MNITHDFSTDIKLSEFLAAKGSIVRATVHEKDGVKQYGCETASGVSIKFSKTLNEEILAGKKLNLHDENLMVQSYMIEGNTKYNLYRRSSALQTVENIFA